MGHSPLGLARKRVAMCKSPVYHVIIWELVTNNLLESRGTQPAGTTSAGWHGVEAVARNAEYSNMIVSGEDLDILGQP